MTVDEFLKENEIFTQTVIGHYNFFTKLKNERDMLNHEMSRRFGTCELIDETADDVHNSVDFAILQYSDFFTKMNEMLTKDLDPTLIEKVIGVSDTTAGGTTKNEGDNTSTNSERTYDDEEMTDTDKNVSVSNNTATSQSTGHSNAETTRTKGFTAGDANDIITLHLRNLYDEILTKVSNDIVIPIYENDFYAL